MTWVEALSIASGLCIGYFLVSAFVRGSSEPADEDGDAPPPHIDPGARGPRPWHEVLEVSEWASDEQIEAAYRLKSSQYHPDKVATMGAEIRALANEKMAEINAAWNAARHRR